MTIVNENYDKLFPLMKYLSDEVVLTESWKKTHSYIRKHNWYSDVLELDCSTIDLEKKVGKWAAEISEFNCKPKDMRLVLAPKHKKWSFKNEKNKPASFDSWGPYKTISGKETERDKQPLRPLAHLSIRDQIFASTVMICLADAIETIQGPSDETNFHLAQRNKMYSYGNRLQCSWEAQPDNKKLASFGWGNSQCYRKYFEDYQNFLKRPRALGQYYASIASPEAEIYIISLDLEQFYNLIDRKGLINELKKHYDMYFKDFREKLHVKTDDLKNEQVNDSEVEQVIIDKGFSDTFPKFWGAVEKIFSWEWDSRDKIENETLYDEPLPKGIPQGLVASGFLSNAYMIGFDQRMGEILHKDSNIEGYIIRDYCRYVDDIRIVVEVSSEQKPNEVKKKIEEWITEHLNEYQLLIGVDEAKLNINKEKTKVLPFQQLAPQNHVSLVMSQLQHTLSGTPDFESIQQTITNLDGLLQLSEHLETEKQKVNNPLELSRISTLHVDVRDDTLKRFAAVRIVRSLRFQRTMTNLEEVVGDDNSEQVKAGQLLDFEFESIARKIIACWAENPSLTLLLRCAFDLYPDASILESVIEALSTKLFYTSEKAEELLANKKLRREVKVAEYVAADLFQAAATTIGYRPENLYPESVSITDFRSSLGEFANKLMDKASSPWYVKQQAILFLCSIGEYNFSIDINIPELKYYGLLHDACRYSLKDKVDVLECLAVALIAQQINPNPKRFSSWFIPWVDNINDQQHEKVLNTLFLNRPDLMFQVLQSSRLKNAEWKKSIPHEIKQVHKVSGSKDIKLSGTSDLSLLRVIRSKSNPFKQENALLLLARAILKSKNIQAILSKTISINNMLVSCVEWDNIQNPNINTLTVKFDPQIRPNTLYETPSWIKEGCEWLYNLGQILRSCVTGEFDFTAHSFLARHDVDSYRGLRSTWYTRRLGMNNHARGLLKEPSPLSPWICELLFCLLQWPGINKLENQITSLENVRHTGDLLLIIEERLAEQKRIYGRLSNTPFYILPSPNRGSRSTKNLRVAVVQPLLPNSKDFSNQDPLHWTPEFRAIHRNHLASMCKLVTSHITAKLSASGTFKNNSERKEHEIDLIVFPELTVHPDDIDLLRGLSDATRANIFAGLTFVRSEKLDAAVNQALWLIRIERSTGREFLPVYQGKEHMTNSEKELHVKGHRPYQVIVEFGNHETGITRLAGAICYDATDLSLVADLRDISDVFLIAAMNQDVNTFDNMVAALHYHMYQPVVLANSGEFGGSTVQAPFKKHERQIAHVHGSNQVAVSMFEIDASVFKPVNLPSTPPERKTPPAGYTGRNH